MGNHGVKITGWYDLLTWDECVEKFGGPNKANTMIAWGIQGTGPIIKYINDVAHYVVQVGYN